MPPLTRWFIKTGLLYLVLSLVTGVIAAADPVVQLPYPLAGLMPLYFQLLMLGWITQLIFGIAYWMFPIASRENPRGNPRLGWVAYICLNAGLLIRGISELTNALNVFHFHALPWATGLSLTLQLVAALAFVANTWARVKGR